MLDLNSTTNDELSFVVKDNIVDADFFCQVISKLTDGKANHIPYRDSKLTRLLQSSLSGHGRVSVRLFMPYYLNEFCFKFQRCFIDLISIKKTLVCSLFCICIHSLYAQLLQHQVVQKRRIIHWNLHIEQNTLKFKQHKIRQECFL